MSDRRYSVTVPDADYYYRLVNCRGGCPVGTDAQAYVEAIARGEYESAYWIAREHNPLASICGAICGARCEAACRRGVIDAPVAIRALKHFVTMRYGVESMLRSTFIKGLKARIRRAPETGRKIAVVGSGPAGLSAAHDLALLGHAVEIFEAEHVPGGMKALGIPKYRLSRDVLMREIDVILALGPKLHLGVRVGKDVTIRELREKFDAVLIAIGLQVSRPVPVPGASLPGVMDGIQFLRGINVGHPADIGERVIVIGGGNVAVDVARSAVRLGSRHVQLVCLESRAEMPAAKREVEEAVDEGIALHPSWGPREIVQRANEELALELVRCMRVFDAERKFRPEFDESVTHTLHAETILVAIGQQADLAVVQPGDGLETTPRGFKTAGGPQLTTAEGVWLAGDCAHGPGLLIDAVASGQRAAAAIHRHLGGAVPVARREWISGPVQRHELRRFDPRLVRCDPSIVSAAARRAEPDAVVERGYSESEAKMQANRCLRCNLNPIFHAERCILCGGCVDVCPENCLKIIDSRQARPTPELERLVAGRQVSFMIKDDERCIRCGLCALRCPTGAVRMERVVVIEEKSHGVA